VSCGDPGVQVRIPFELQFDSMVLDCSTPQSGVSLTDFRVYVHDIRLISVGRATDVALIENRWQQSDLAMLDFEDGTGECINGTSETNFSLHGTVPAGDYRGLQFEIGVPFDRNHADPLLATAPLDDAAMHWHWRAGYKFLRAGLSTEFDGFWLHLGSAGCEGTVRNISSCRYPNRVVVELPDFVANQDTVIVDLSALNVATNLEDRVPTDCSSGPPERACAAPFAALGIDHDSGKRVHQQRVFLQKAMQ